ncbi:8-amino-7-oxononanoate synthase [Lysobacter xinjiangensis]|uniref:8-amino-7-oxononanoate synthase n=1 Tax=Cognatilysobacter xinjiangensis TaxID=546892 RepID=A0ABQ3C4V3_9GAMM|nr:8-amino-7-oxononanoate synthase [Lysobacter xinjiangensis]
MIWRERIAESNAARDAAARRRVRRTVGKRDGMRCEVDGRALLNFCSNDYLGLSQHPEVIAALRDASVDGVGSTASHLVCGHHALHDALEREMADWLQAPRALLFGSGFVANLAVLQALLRKGDVCLQDRLNHASLIDAARLSDATLRRYPHGEVGTGERHIVAAGGAPALIATDGVFSMDGDVAPLHDLVAVARHHDALLYVDDAHGIGVLGPEGRGSVAAAGYGVRDVPLQLATLGKALGTYGAVVVGDEDIVQYLSETARGYVYTTALPPPLAAASLAAVRIARRADDRRDTLRALVARFRERAAQNGLDVLPSDTPIQAVMTHDDRRALAMSKSLEDAGYWVSAIRPPTVPEGAARLRVTLTALHAPHDVDALVEALARARDTAFEAVSP